MCNSKKEIRNAILESRKSLSQTFISDNSLIISQKLFNMDIYINSSIIYIYMGVNGEVNTETIINHSIKEGKKVALPKITNKKMDFFYISNLDQLEKGFFNIPEPVTNDLAFCNNGLMIMPGLAFDKEFNRIGYGGGYYDKYLSNYKNFCKLGLSFEFQIIENIKKEEHDILLDYIVTEQNIFVKDGGMV